MNDLKILALIPARSGSKGLPNKNIMSLNGKPLIAYSIEHALDTPEINRIIVSTDSKEYAKIARDYGAETPFIRPKNISEDLSTDLEVFEHALDFLLKNEKYTPNLIVHLRPTNPIRKIEDISACIKILIDNSEIDSVRSLIKSPHSPYKMWIKKDINSNFIKPFATCNIKESHSVARQVLPEVFLHNGSIDVIRSEVINEQKSIVGKKVFGYLMDEIHDIDYEKDFNNVNDLLKNK